MNLAQAIGEWEDSEAGDAWRRAQDDAADDDRRRYEEMMMADDREALTVRLTGLLGDLDELLTWASTRPGVVPPWLLWITQTCADAIRQYRKES